MTIPTEIQAALDEWEKDVRSYNASVSSWSPRANKMRKSGDKLASLLESGKGGLTERDAQWIANAIRDKTRLCVPLYSMMTDDENYLRAAHAIIAESQRRATEVSGR